MGGVVVLMGCRANLHRNGEVSSALELGDVAVHHFHHGVHGGGGQQLLEDFFRVRVWPENDVVLHARRKWSHLTAHRQALGDTLLMLASHSGRACVPF